jgi:ATP-dependent DNA helicase RecG
MEILAAEKYFEKMKKEYFVNYNIALLHGRMKTDEKNSVMAKFASGEISILVSTTVIEIGIDIPNAVFMVIENAERFGLSQLHQLRGRVGRGGEKSYCVLISDAKSQKSIKRLAMLSQINDGFKIAHEDLKMRGPGEFFGVRQHGLPELKIANFFEDIKIFKKTQELANQILEKDPQLANSDYRFLKAQIKFLFKKGFFR